MYDLRTIHRSPHLRSLGGFLLGVFYCFSVAAQGSSSNGWSYYPMPDGRTVIYSGGAPIGSLPVTSSAPVGAPVVANGKGISTAGGPVIASGRVPVVIGKGAPVVVDVVAKVPPSAVAALIKKALPLVPVLGTGVALYDLAKELGFTPRGSGSNLSLDVAPSGAAFFTSAEWSQCRADFLDGCDVRRDGYNGLGGCHPPDGLGRWIMYPIGNYSYAWAGYCPTGTEPGVPATLQQLEDAIAAKSGWPSSSAVSRAVAQASNVTGDPVPVEGPHTVSGPASSAPSTSTTTNPDGSKSVTTTTNNYTYQGDTINTTTVTTVTNYNTSNQVTGTTTTTTQPPPEKATDCEKNPESNACRTDEFDTPEGDIPKETRNVAFTPADLGFGGGTCPQNVVQTIHGQQITVINWTSSCAYIVDYVKPLVLMLATFAALLIIFLGGKTE